MIKVAIDAHLLGNNIDGIGRYLLGLLNSLTKASEEFYFYVIINNQLDREKILPLLNSSQIELLTVNFSNLDLFKQNIVIPKLLHKVKPDVYHHPHFDLPLTIRVPSVVTIHDLKYIHHKYFFDNLKTIKSYLMKYLMQYSLKKAVCCIAVSNTTKIDIQQTFNINDSKLVVIHHGIDDIEQTREKERIDDVLKKYNLVNKYILFVGSKRPHKNIVGTIKAYNMIKEKANVDLVIVGKPYSNYCYPSELVNQLRLNSSVIFIEDVDDSELTQIYKHANQFVFPSFYEGFGFPVLEAMKYGVAVIASNTTSLPEIVGDAGILIDPNNIHELANAMEMLLKDSALRKKLIERGFKRIQQFTWDMTAQNTLEVYKKVYNETY